MRREAIHDYKSRTPSRRKVVVGLLVAWLTSTAVAAAGVSRMIEEPLPTAHELAVAIAEGERERLDALPFEELAETDGYRVADWIRSRGLEPGEVELPVEYEDQEPAKVPFRVEWRVDPQNGEDHLRRIAVRVSWVEPGRLRGQVERTALRAGGVIRD